MYDLKQTQNFLTNSDLVKKLIDDSDISGSDLVLDIGAGKGLITELLSFKAQEVYGYELDLNLFNDLNFRFKENKNVKLFSVDFLKFPLPYGSYKVFANIPFAISTEILDKLIGSVNPPISAYLIVQKEFSNKFVGEKESLKSLIYKPFFEFKVVHTFNKKDYRPIPSVETVLFYVFQKDTYNFIDKDLYRDFITYLYTSWKPNIKQSLSLLFSKTQYERLSKENDINLDSNVSSLSLEQVLAIYTVFVSLLKDKHFNVKGSCDSLLKQQKGLHKINRSRTDINWRQKG